MCSTLEMGVNVHMCLVGSSSILEYIFINQVCFSCSSLELKQKFSKLADYQSELYEKFKNKNPHPTLQVQLILELPSFFIAGKSETNDEMQQKLSFEMFQPYLLLILELMKIQLCFHNNVLSFPVLHFIVVSKYQVVLYLKAITQSNVWDKGSLML